MLCKCNHRFTVLDSLYSCWKTPMINLLGQEIIETRESSDKEVRVKEWGENRSEYEGRNRLWFSDCERVHVSHNVYLWKIGITYMQSIECVCAYRHTFARVRRWNIRFLVSLAFRTEDPCHRPLIPVSRNRKCSHALFLYFARTATYHRRFGSEMLPI